ncbi:tauPI-stichotoxin-Hcr2b-like [Leptopilina boulardi]|uniref:tauPI-stichotoxin-Hcr2b-like n=1 Tax=Leptopilina boulardi TaxID=63433 RepID=UPI0021F5D74F|nr:tauPI-stichotoxin-Hcr2b-like [Leptopilina boulardi]
MAIFHLSFFIICIVALQAITTSAASLNLNVTDVCLQPIEVGICRAEVKSYGFDSTQQKCVQFVYGGCNGNENRFTKLEDCQVACEECSQPIVAGPCYGLNEKYGFNTEEKKCVAFTYGGCMGNKNSFDTLEACEKKCM